MIINLKRVNLPLHGLNLVAGGVAIGISGIWNFFQNGFESLGLDQVVQKMDSFSSGLLSLATKYETYRTLAANHMTEQMLKTLNELQISYTEEEIKVINEFYGNGFDILVAEATGLVAKGVSHAVPAITRRVCLSNTALLKRSLNGKLLSAAELRTVSGGGLKFTNVHLGSSLELNGLKISINGVSSESITYFPQVVEVVKRYAINNRFTKKAYRSYLHEVTKGMSNAEKITFANNKISGYFEIYDHLQKTYGYTEGIRRWDLLTKSKVMRAEVSVLKEIANESGAQMHHTLFQSMAEDTIVKIDSTFNMTR